MPDSQKKHPSPPYATFAPLINFLNKLRENGVPGRIDPSVFGNVSGSVSYSAIAALKALKLIESNGVPKDEFRSLVVASDEDRKPLFRDAMRNAYPTFSEDQFPLTNATASQFDEHIRENYEAKGSTVDKVAAFFIAAAEYSGISISELIKARKPSASSSRTKKKEPDAIPAVPTESRPLREEQSISDKALEYKLVDLMRESDVMDGERDAIWILLQYLTKKQKKAADQ